MGAEIKIFRECQYRTASSPASAPAPISSPVGEPGKIIQPTPSASKDDSQDPAKQRGTIKVRVNLVNVLASVLDENNRPAPDLPKEAFQIFEEGVQQKINVFESETSQPLDLALMIDASLSAHKEITFEQEAAAHFIRQVLRPGDRLSVFSFDENVTQVAPISPTTLPNCKSPFARFPLALALPSTTP